MLQRSIIKKPNKKKTSHSDNEVYNEVVLISEQICYFLIYCRATERPFLIVITNVLKIFLINNW